MATTGSTSSQPGRTLPLFNCPQCLVSFVRRLSKNGNFYYKCPCCRKWWFGDAYEAYLRSDHANLLASSSSGHNVLGAVEVVQQPAGTPAQGIQQSCGELKMVARDLKLLLGETKLEIRDLKKEVKELKEMKGKNPIVLDNAAVVVFMAIFVAVLVAFVWKK